MDQDPNELREQVMAETPDDIATLYSWANLHGAKYRDFSASRREHRIQVRDAMRASAEAASREESLRQSSFVPEPQEFANPSYPSSEPAVTYVREYTAPGGPPSAVPTLPQDNPLDQNQYSRAVEAQSPGHPSPNPRPAWLYAEAQPHYAAQPPLAHQPMAPQHPQPPMQHPQQPIQDTLQHQRERVASRWFALKGVFDAQQEAEQPAAPPRDGRAPVIAVFSLAGGVGKTSLVATIGRALSSLGERNLIVDTSSYGLLPFYFGSKEWRPGSVRTFSPPAGTSDAAISLVTYDGDKYARETASDWLQEEISRGSYGMQRVLLDVAGGGSPIARQALRLADIVLVPVVPDLGSVVSLTAAENFLRPFTGPDGRPLTVYYVMNQFDPSLPLHLDVREVLREKLGDRLLPAAIHRSPAVAESLAEGMTVVDYAPGSPVANDYLNIAAWLRNISAPATGVPFRGARWSER